MRNNTKNIESKNRRKKEGDEKVQREKTFDKKKYRLKKYSNKYKSKSTVCICIIQVELHYPIYIRLSTKYLLDIYFFASVNQWEERRKKAILREFHKELKRNQNSTQTSINLNDTSENLDETRYVK